MPSVAARNFKKTIENNTNTGLNKTIFWESDAYDLNVERWMEREILEQEDTSETSGKINVTTKKERELVPGQYVRTFTQQNKAEITWSVTNKMRDLYSYDRQNAFYNQRSKGAYPRVPFATDRELQKYAYPFKSGYYFNPAGAYQVTITTNIFKDVAEPTQEHLALVNRLVDSFRYTSTMNYVDEYGNEEGNLALQIEGTADGNDDLNNN